MNWWTECVWPSPLCADPMQVGLIGSTEHPHRAKRGRGFEFTLCLTVSWGIDLLVSSVLLVFKPHHQLSWASSLQMADHRTTSQLPKHRRARSAHMAQWVKDPVFSLEWLRWLLWGRFSPWPGNIHILWTWPKKQQTNKKTKPEGPGNN